MALSARRLRFASLALLLIPRLSRIYALTADCSEAGGRADLSQGTADVALCEWDGDPIMWFRKHNT